MITEAELNIRVNECADSVKAKGLHDVRSGTKRASQEALDQAEVRVIREEMKNAEKQISETELENAGKRASSQHDYQGFMSELDSSLREIQAAMDRVHDLDTHFAFDRLIPFDRVSNRVTKAGALLSEAWAEIRCSQVELMATTRTNTRGLDLHKYAVRLAYALVGRTAPRRTREIARRIMDKAGLNPPDEKSLSNWIKEIKAEWPHWNGK